MRYTLGLSMERMMRIGLIAEKTIDRDLDHNFSRMKAWLQRCAGTGFELLCFGEAFAHGFEALSWNHEQDLAIALERDDTHILDLGAQARQAGTGIAFGYIEKSGEKLYSSYMVISANGEALINFQRVSPGWKVHSADARFYMEGSDYTPFNLGGKSVGIAICGDLWHDELLEKFEQQKSDLLLWPLYIDYSREDWYASEREVYAQRVWGLKRPALMVNSLSNASPPALGGCYVFNSGRIEQELLLGESGMLTVQI